MSFGNPNESRRQRRELSSNGKKNSTAFGFYSTNKQTNKRKKKIKNFSKKCHLFVDETSPKQKIFFFFLFIIIRKFVVEEEYIVEEEESVVERELFVYESIHRGRNFFSQ